MTTRRLLDADLSVLLYAVEPLFRLMLEPRNEATATHMRAPATGLSFSRLAKEGQTDRFRAPLKAKGVAIMETRVVSVWLLFLQDRLPTHVCGARPVSKPGAPTPVETGEGFASPSNLGMEKHLQVLKPSAARLHHLNNLSKTPISWPRGATIS